MSFWILNALGFYFCTQLPKFYKNAKVPTKGYFSFVLTGILTRNSSGIHTAISFVWSILAIHVFVAFIFLVNAVAILASELVGFALQRTANCQLGTLKLGGSTNTGKEKVKKTITGADFLHLYCHFMDRFYIHYNLIISTSYRARTQSPLESDAQLKLNYNEGIFWLLYSFDEAIKNYADFVFRNQIFRDCLPFRRFPLPFTLTILDHSLLLCYDI